MGYSSKAKSAIMRVAIALLYAMNAAPQLLAGSCREIELQESV
jgi:hypothetical protein